MGGQPPKDDSAEKARKAEEERAARVAEGTESINAAFQQFDDPYFDQARQTNLDFYQPELQDQYQDAYRKMVLDLNRSRNLNSSAGARTLGNLQERMAQETTQMGGRADDYAAARRAEVENSRSNLVNQLNASADPAAANTAALAQAQQLGRQQTLSPLGAVFADLIQTTGQGLAAERAGYQGMNTGLFKPKGAGKVVYG